MSAPWRRGWSIRGRAGAGPAGRDFQRSEVSYPERLKVLAEALDGALIGKADCWVMGWLARAEMHTVTTVAELIHADGCRAVPLCPARAGDLMSGGPPVELPPSATAAPRGLGDGRRHPVPAPRRRAPRAAQRPRRSCPAQPRTPQVPAGHTGTHAPRSADKGEPVGEPVREVTSYCPCK